MNANTRNVGNNIYILPGSQRGCGLRVQPPGGTPHNGLYGEAQPERGTLFKLDVHKRVGSLRVEVQKRAEKTVIDYFRFAFCLCFKTSSSENLSYENEFDLHLNQLVIKNDLHIEGSTFGLVLKERQRETRKWSV